MIDAAFGNWLAGFIDGEGCFLVSTGGRGPLPWCRFRLVVRLDDGDIVREVHTKTGIGKVRLIAVTQGNPLIAWEMAKLADCQTLVALLEQHPLRAKKRRDFAIWALAVAEQAAHQQGCGQARQDRGGHIERMMAYKDALVATRRYKGGDVEMPALAPRPSQLRLVG